MIRTSHLFLMAGLLAPCSAVAQVDSTHATPAPIPAARRAALIKSALSAAPKNIQDNAAIMAPMPGGQMVKLRDGTNGFTCIPDDLDHPGAGPMCADAEGMKWAGALMSHAPKPENTAPGLIYMLAGGTDVSATDPWAKPTGAGFKSPPHWMLMWPMDPATSGLPTSPKTTGTWIMWSGTPYAHLMINQVP